MGQISNNLTVSVRILMSKDSNRLLYLAMKATPRPWYATGIHVQSAAINEDNYVCTAEGNSPEQAIANAALIVKAVNSLVEE